MKSLEFTCHSTVKFLPYKDFFWQERSKTVLSKWFFDVSASTAQSSLITGLSPTTQSLVSFGSRLLYNTHLFGLNTVYATPTQATAANYANFYSGSALGPTTSSNVHASDYVSPEALWNSSLLPDKIYENSTINASSMTASFATIRSSGYKPSTSLALQNYFCEIENFYGVERSVLKSTKRPDSSENKFRILESTANSSNSMRSIVLYVAIDNQYMPTTNFDFIGPWPWYANLPYGGLGQHTANVFDQATLYDSFEADATNKMLRSHLNVADRRLLKGTLTIENSALEEVGFEEFMSSASFLTISDGFDTYGGYDSPQNEHTMDMRHNLIYGVDSEGFPFFSTKGENISALLNASSSSYSITAMSGTVTADVPGVVTVSSYVEDYTTDKGIYFKILDPSSISTADREDFNDGDISAAKLFGFDGTRRVGQISKNKLIEEAVVMVPMIGEKGCKAEPILLNETHVLNRLFFLEKNGKTRFKYFTEKQLNSVVIERRADESGNTNFIDDLILSMEKFIFPPEMDWLMSIRRLGEAGKLAVSDGGISINADSIAPYFAVVFQFAKDLSRNERVALWQANLTGSLSTPEEREQTISVPIEEVFGSDFKFENKIIRAQTFKAKFRAETNYDVYGKKKTGQDYDKKLDYDWSYNWPYDHCTILPLNKISAKVYCKEEE